MNSKRILFFLGISAIFILTSCSGSKNNTCVTNCGGGNSSLSVTISDTPPTGTAILSLTLPVLGVSLTPSGGGSQVSVFSSNPSTDFELTHLQSDTNLVISNVSVAAGTYTAVTVTVIGPSGMFINDSGAQIGSCLAGAVCALSQSGAQTITYTFSNGSPLVLTANLNQRLNLDFNYSNAIITTNGIGLDVTQTGVLTASTTVPTGIPSGDVANIDDFTGAITAISSSSITLQSSVRGKLTASISSTIPVYDPQSQCQGTGSLSCIGPGSIVSLQGVLSNAGAVNATSLDVIDASTTPADEVEGTIYPSTCNGTGSYGLILSDSTIFTASSPLASANFGAGVCLTLNSSTTFAIDDGILTGQGVPIVGFTNSNDILAGQTVRAKVTGAVTGANGINVTATAMILRWSQFTAAVNNISGNILTVGPLPSYLTGNPTQVVTFPNATILEGAADVSGLNGQTVSFSALYLNPQKATYPFQAAKVRVQ